MNTSRIVAAASLLALMLTSCSPTPPQAPPSVSVPPAATQSPTPTPTPTAARKENSRGQIIKEIGEAAILTHEGVPTMTFKVSSIKPIQCDAPYAVPPTGTILAVALEVATNPDFLGSLTVNGQEGQISFGAHYWKGYANNGTRMNTIESTAVQNCLADKSQLLPDFFGKGEQLNGLVLLDVTSPSGEVAFDPSGFGGWVWKYPSA